MRNSFHRCIAFASFLFHVRTLNAVGIVSLTSLKGHEFLCRKGGTFVVSFSLTYTSVLNYFWLNVVYEHGCFA